EARAGDALLLARGPAAAGGQRGEHAGGDHSAGLVPAVSHAQPPRAPLVRALSAARCRRSRPRRRQYSEAELTPSPRGRPRARLDLRAPPPPPVPPTGPTGGERRSVPRCRVAFRVAAERVRQDQLPGGL